MIRIPKKWRELSKEKKLQIPTKIFDINEKEVERIRKIADTKNKLIEAAKLQYETFQEIHSYLTTWIAGFSSDVIIRQNFGSTKNLINLFFKPIKFPAGITPSWADTKRRIKIPEEMTEKLAEETGVHIGDGNLSISKDSGGFEGYRYEITGDLINEAIYHEEYLSKLIFSMYNLKPSILKREEKNSIDTYCKSKAIVQFKNKILGLPIGSKKDIKIPLQILKNNDFQKRCIIGIIDTDFHITENMSISGKLNNLFVVKQMKKILDKNNIPNKLSIYSDYGRFYIKKEGAIKIIQEWKLKNQKHLSKYYLFEEYHKFLPFTTTPERLAVLSGKLNIKELEEISKKRRASPGGISAIF